MKNRYYLEKDNLTDLKPWNTLHNVTITVI